MQLGTRSSTHLIHPVRQRRLWPRPSSSHASRIHEIVTPLSTGYTCPVTIRASLPRRARGTSSYAESQVRNRLVWGFSCQAVVLGCAESFLFGAGKAVFRPVACNQVPGARGRGQGTETLAELGGLPPSVACVSQRLDA